jgi:hypothetical protein
MRTNEKWKMLLKRESNNWLNNIKLNWKRRGMNIHRRCLKMLHHFRNCRLRRRKIIGSLRRLYHILGMNIIRILDRLWSSIEY